MKEEQNINGLPKNWQIKPLGEVCEKITKGGTPTTYGFAFVSEGVNFVKIENIENGKVNLKSIRTFISKDAHSHQKKSQLEKNDLLFSIAGTIGETCLIKEEYLPANTNQALAILRGYDRYLKPQFLTYQLNSSIAQMVKSKARGGAMNNISLEDLKAINISIPLFETQEQIVLKIEELFSELDKGIEEIKIAQQQLKVYRQAVLKWAFEGKLTNENVKHGMLPQGWTMQSLGDATKNFDGKRVPLSRTVRSKRKGTYRYYGATEIVDHIDDFIFEGKYLLIGEDGANLLSKNRSLAFIVEGQFWVNNHAHVLQTKENLLIKFLMNYFNSINIGQYVTGTAQPKLTQANLNKIPIPIPSVEEQQHIVQEIESRLSVCDKIEETITKSLKQAEALRQSILKKAFEGKLL